MKPNLKHARKNTYRSPDPDFTSRDNLDVVTNHLSRGNDKNLCGRKNPWFEFFAKTINTWIESKLQEPSSVRGESCLGGICFILLDIEIVLICQRNHAILNTLRKTKGVHDTDNKPVHNFLIIPNPQQANDCEFNHGKGVPGDGEGQLNVELKSSSTSQRCQNNKYTFTREFLWTVYEPGKPFPFVCTTVKSILKGYQDTGRGIGQSFPSHSWCFLWSHKQRNWRGQSFRLVWHDRVGQCQGALI